VAAAENGPPGLLSGRTQLLRRRNRRCGEESSQLVVLILLAQFLLALLSSLHFILKRKQSFEPLSFGVIFLKG